MANGSRYAPYAFCGVLVGRRDRLSKRKKLKATKCSKRRRVRTCLSLVLSQGSTARCGGRRHGTPTILFANEYQTHLNQNNE